MTGAVTAASGWNDGGERGTVRPGARQCQRKGKGGKVEQKTGADLFSEPRARLEELLGEPFQGFEPLNTGPRSQVARCHLHGGRSVIAKVFTEVKEPARREWDALRFLSEPLPSIAPRPLARAKDGHIIVMEDLQGETLARVLARESEAGARRPLLDVAGALGHLHGVQRSRLSALPESLRGEYLKQADDCAGLRNQVRALLERAEVEPVSDFDSAWQELVERMGRPGPFLTLTHGDLAPSNVLLTSEGPRLLDFEYSGARSALYDAMFWEAVVPFPRTLARAMTRTYRDVLGSYLPEAREEECFRRELVALKTHRLYWGLTFRLDAALASADGHWVPGWRLRTAYLFYLHNHVTTCQRLGGQGPLLQTAQALFSCLSRRWNERAGFPDNFLPVPG